jgi:hypothetical protein
MRVSHGLHRPVEQSSDLPAWQLVLPPSGRFAHVTGAALHGLWLPPLPHGLPVFAAMVEAQSRPQRAGLRVSRHHTVPAHVVLDGLRVDPVAEVLLACARDLGLLDLVVVTDSALHMGVCTPAALEELAGGRRRGAPALRRALALADARAESPWETLLRLLHVACEVPVEPQHELRDEDGVLVARADLWLSGTNAVHEYDGSVHLTRPQQRKDLQRARRIGNQTWVRRGYTSGDVLHQAVGILRDADLSLGREHRPERVRRWHEWLTDSLFTPSGRERLARRLGLEPGTGGIRHVRGA